MTSAGILMAVAADLEMGNLTYTATGLDGLGSKFLSPYNMLIPGAPLTSTSSIKVGVMRM